MAQRLVSAQKSYRTQPKAAGAVAALGTKAQVAQARRSGRAQELKAERWLRELVLAQQARVPTQMPAQKKMPQASLEQELGPPNSRVRKLPELPWEQAALVQKLYLTRWKLGAASGRTGPPERQPAFPARGKSLPAWKRPAHSKWVVRTRERSRQHWQPPGAREPPPEHSAPQVIATRRHGRR